MNVLKLVSDEHCHCCNERPGRKVVVDGVDSATYWVCAACEKRLAALALRPLEWFNLARLYSPWRHHLHDDFYDDDGTGHAAEWQVDDAAAFPYPELTAAQSDPALAVDIAYSKWWLKRGSDLASILRSLNDRLVPFVEVAMNTRNGSWFRQRGFEILAIGVGPSADALVRDQLQHVDAQSIYAAAEAVAACLPTDEAISWAIHAVSAFPDVPARDTVRALKWFNGPKVYDKLETMVCAPVTDVWGYVAARCGLVWGRARGWLRAGRPLSIVALDALNECIRGNRFGDDGPEPQLEERPTQNELEQELKQYLAMDSAPRIKNTVASILAGAEKITGASLS